MTVKKQLVDRMIAKGNNYRYTDMVKEVLDIVYGGKVQYNWRDHRGFYATNFSFTSGGYMVSGEGDCGVYQSNDGKWHAKYYTKEEMLEYRMNKALTYFRKEVQLITSNILKSNNHNFRMVLLDDIESKKEEVKNKIIKTVNKLYVQRNTDTSTAK